MKPFLAAYARKSLTVFSVYLMNAHLLASDQQAQFIGGGMLFASIAWEWWATYGHAKVADLLKKLTARPTVAQAVATAQVAPAGIAVKALLLFAILILGTIMVPRASYAATATDSLAKLMAQVSAVQADAVAKAVAALQEADTDAGTVVNATTGEVRDPISHACYPAQIKLLQSLPVVQPINAAPPFDLIVLFQRKRDFVAQIKAGVPAYLVVGCAGLLGDEVQTFIQTVGLVGIKIAAPALAGIFPPLAPIALPALALTAP